MKKVSRFVALLLVLLVSKKQYAQTFEFIENKGQWDSKVMFKCKVNGAVFYLQRNGYKVLLNNDTDVTSITEYFGGHHPLDGEPSSNNGGSTGGGKPAANSAAKSVSTNPTRDNGDNGGGGSGGGGAAPTFTLRSHAYEVTFAGSMKQIMAVPEKALGSSVNYFLGSDSSKWASDCKTYSAVVYKNVYPNIDVRYYIEHDQLKYDFIVNPGGNVNNIALQFDGPDGLSVKNDNLIIKTSVGDISEQKPYSYQVSNNGKKEITTKYVVGGNIVKFKTGDYNKNATIIIDPQILVSTYTGSKSDNWGYTATYDGLGNIYGGGIVFGDQYPVSNGAFQTKFAGASRQDGSEGSIPPMDIGIIKLNPNGTNRLYATYLGGTGYEQPNSMIVDKQGNLVVVGRTSSKDFPSTLPKYGPEADANTYTADIFITKFNSTGTALIASRRVGGVGNDGVNIAPKYLNLNGAIATRRNYGDDARSEVIIDDANNILVAAQTQSIDFPVTPGAFQQTSAGGDPGYPQDGVVMKFTANLTPIFSTYLGGKGIDALFVLAINPVNGNIYVGGASTSPDFPKTSGASSGSTISGVNKGGACDGIVSILTPDGTQVIKSSYFGTSGNDMIFGVQFDKAGNFYIMGTTTGRWDTLNTPYTNNGVANARQFISKLTPDLSSYIYSTVFGPGSTYPNISPTAFLVDRCENVYVSGWGGGEGSGGNKGYENSSTAGLTTTPDAIYPNIGRDDMDFYFFVLKKNAASLLYATMFGQTGGYGDHVDGGTSRFDKEGIIYQAMCANCGGSGGQSGFQWMTTTAGAWASSNGALNANKTSGGCNEALIKIAFNLAGVGAGVRSAIGGVPYDTLGCVPLTVDFRDTIALGKKYIWNFGDGTPEVTTTVPTQSHTFTQIGLYHVTLVSIDSSSCNVADTSTINISVRDNKANLGFDAFKLPPCDSLKYQFINTSTATTPFQDTSFAWTFGDGSGIPSSGMQTVYHTYQAAGTYNVELRLRDTSYCNYDDTIMKQIRIATNVKAQFDVPAAICYPLSAVFNNTSMGGASFEWDFGDGTTSTEVSPEHFYPAPGTYQVTLVANDPNTCNKTDTLRKSILVSAKPTASFTYGPNPPKENTAVNFYNSSLLATHYNWSFGDGEFLATKAKDTTVSHLYNSTGTFTACLAAINDVGCADTMCQNVKAIIVPLVDVPNAFTPNGDGVNDYVNVRGYGITKLTFRIYNRWGTMVYQATSNKQIGWDGRYNGVLQPQDVYTYIADIEFYDGTTFQKKGDITLLR